MNKHNFLWFLLVLIMAVSCTKNEADEESSQADVVPDLNLLYGKWKAAAYSIDAESCSYENWMQINEDGSMQNYNDCLETTTNGDWEYDGSTFTWTDALLDIPIPCEVLNLTETEFKIEFQDVITTYEKQ